MLDRRPRSADEAPTTDRTREVVQDVAATQPIERLADLIGPAGKVYRDGETLGPLAHWLLFHPRTAHAERGADGHPRRGGFLPDLKGLPRRMWVGNDITIHAPLTAGAALTRVSEVASVERKTGRSGELGFVTVRHNIADGGRPLVGDRQTLVYRPAGSSGQKAVRDGPKTTAEPVAERTLTPDPVMLFAYSALTQNGHRIHYDATYAREVEGYPDLVVHGPLIATLLVDLASQTRPEAGVARLSYRALNPLFVNRPVTLRFWSEGEDAEAWAFGEDGTPAARVALTFAGDVR